MEDDHAGDFFICFASRRRRPSRLRTSGSMKGGQSPGMFSSRKKKSASSAFESSTAEPSSPKVTCIGQVRVRTSRRRRKKAAAAATAAAESAVAMRSRSRSRSRSRRETSFRRTEQEQQSWVHLPFGVVSGALKAFGSEVNCFSSQCCFASSSSSCCFNGCERKRARRSLKEEEDVVVEEMGLRRERRELDLVADELERGVGLARRNEEDDEEGDAPVCVPPKNALLLMRCRSDPARVSALQNQFQRSPITNIEIEGDDDGGDEEGDDEEVVEEEADGDVEHKECAIEGREENHAEVEIEEKVRFWQQGQLKYAELRNGFASESTKSSQNLSKEVSTVEEQKGTIVEVTEDQVEKTEEKEVKKAMEQWKKPPSGATPATMEETRRRSTSKDRRRSISSEKDVRRSTSYREGRRSSFSSETDARRSSFSAEKETRRRWSFSSEKESKTTAAAAKLKRREVGEDGKGKDEVEKRNELPDCLLLMMYEPKLSMEVSKETWVCTSDFLRWQPHRSQHRQVQEEKNKATEVVASAEENKGGECDDENKEVATAPNDVVVVSPVAELESIGAAASDVVAVPFVLTRCKSEPTRLRSEAGKMSSMPRLIGAAGIGF